MATPTNQRMTWDLFVQQEHLAVMQIGRWTFGCNPWEVHAPEERATSDVQTKAGPLRNSFGLKAIAYTILGFCANAGVDELHGMEEFRPRYNPDRPYPLTFPMFGIHKESIYINYFEPSVDQELLHYIKYQIRGTFYPVAAPPYVVETRYAPSGVQGALIAP